MFAAGCRAPVQGISEVPTAWHGAFLPPPVQVTKIAGKNEGLTASRGLRKGETIFTEKPVASFSLSSTPHCSHCCRSLVTASHVRERLAQVHPGNDACTDCVAGESVSFARLDACWPELEAVSCTRCEESTYCSNHCMKAAAGYHALLCVGTESQEGTQERLALQDYVDAVSETADCLVKIKTFPGLVVKLVAMMLADARAAAAAEMGDEGPRESDPEIRSSEAGLDNDEDKKTQSLLEDAHEKVLAGMVGVEAAALPDYDYIGFRDAMARGMRLSEGERGWLRVTVVQTVFAVLCANAIRARPSCPFETYVKTLRATTPAQERMSMLDEVVGACRAVCRDSELPANRIDHAMWESTRGVRRTQALAWGADLRVSCYRDVFGTEAACIYRLQCKCNHDCDANAQSVTYTLQDCTLDLVASKDIRAGSEICITYVDPEHTAGRRKRALKEMHGFECACNRCAANERWSTANRSWVSDGCAATEEERGVDADRGNAEDEEAEEDEMESMNVGAVDDFLAILNL